MTILDTSFLFAFFHQEDAFHKEAITQAQKKDRDQTVAIPLEVFEELITVVCRKKGTEAAIKIGKFLLHEISPVQILSPIPMQFLKTWNQFQVIAPHHLSYVDCLLLVLAKEHGCHILTFDKAITERLQ